MQRLLELEGQRFKRLLVLGPAGVVGVGRRQKRMWACRCDCGGSLLVRAESLRSGNTGSCGCARGRRPTHGHARANGKSPEYRTWLGMIGRCHCETSSAYHKYGAKGVTVCESWRNSFEAFFLYMGEKPSPGHSIDRINPFGNYEPENCRWATAREQANNKRKNHKESL